MMTMFVHKIIENYKFYAITYNKKNQLIDR